MKSRRDNRNRVLRVGESQRADGRYAFKYVDGAGKVRFAYSWRLVETDRLPKGKRACVPLREQERAIRRDLEDGMDSRGRAMTVSQLYRLFTECNANVKVGTEYSRGTLMRLLEADELGSRPIEGVRPSDARAWALRLSSQGYAYATISNHKRSLKAAFHLAVQDDLVRKNPFDFKLSDVVEDGTRRKVPLTGAQAEALLRFLRWDGCYRRYHDEVVILLGTGLRISELCGLTESDVDMERRVVRVDHQLLRRRDGTRYVETPKTGAGMRSIYLSPQVFEAFGRVLARPRPESSVEIDGHAGFLFLNRDGLPQTAQGYGSAFRGMARRYARYRLEPALPEVMTAHTLRHTFCTNMALAGMNPKALQHVMGHANIQMTLGYYAHATSETAMEEMRRVTGA